MSENKFHIPSYDNYNVGTEEEVRKALVGRKVISVITTQDASYREDRVGHLILDDGTILKIEGNNGCGGCSSGWYGVDHLATALAGTDNAITAVEFESKPVEESDDVEDDEYFYDGHIYRIFIYAEGVGREKLLEVTGDDGNGYYGTGYTVTVIR